MAEPGGPHVTRMTESPGISLGLLRTSMLEGLDGLASLQDDWLRLARSAEHYFHDYHWFFEWVRHDPELPLGLYFCVVADAAGEVIGIVPLQARVERVRRLPVRVWTLLGSTGGDVMLFASGADFLCRSDADAPRVLAATISHLAKVRPRRHLLQLGRLTSGSRALGAVVGLPDGFAYTRGATFRVSTDRPFEELCSSLSRNMKANLRLFANRSGAQAISHSGLTTRIQPASRRPTRTSSASRPRAGRPRPDQVVPSRPTGRTISAASWKACFILERINTSQ